GLRVRGRDQLDVQPLATNAPRSPFFSPDGRWVGFFEGGELRKVSITGGTSILVCRILGGPRGASWGSDGRIVFATNDPEKGLMTVPAGGGEPTELTKVDFAQRGVDHRFPFSLPSGPGAV